MRKEGRMLLILYHVPEALLEYFTMASTCSVVTYKYQVQ